MARLLAGCVRDPCRTTDSAVGDYGRPVDDALVRPNDHHRDISLVHPIAANRRPTENFGRREHPDGRLGRTQRGGLNSPVRLDNCILDELHDVMTAKPSVCACRNAMTR